MGGAAPLLFIVLIVLCGFTLVPGSIDPMPRIKQLASAGLQRSTVDQERKGKNMAECKACHGNPTCPNCKGKGKILTSSTLFTEKCKRCDGTGKCTVCKGSGKA